MKLWNTRRGFLLGLATAPVAATLAGCARAAEPTAKLPAGDVTIENFDAKGESTGKAKVPKIVKSELNGVTKIAGSPVTEPIFGFACTVEHRLHRSVAVALPARASQRQ